MRRFLNGVAAMALVLAGTACSGVPSNAPAALDAAGGHESQPIAAAAGLAGIPRPSQLERQTAADTESLDGDAFNAGLPPQRVSDAGGGGALYEPDWDAALHPPAAGLAFALYSFPWSGEYLAGLLTLEWTAAPAAGACWIGLADYSNDRWEWHRHTPGTPQVISDLVLYVNDADAVPVLLVLTGTTPATLRRLTLDTYEPAWLGIVDEPAAGTGEPTDPYLVDTEPVLYFTLFDPENWNQVAAAPATQWLVEPAGAGAFLPLVTSVAFQLSGDGNLDFRIGASYQGHPTEPQWLCFRAVADGPDPNQPPVAALDATPVYGAPPLSVEFDARASCDPDDLELEYGWDYDGDGNFDDVGADRQPSHEYAGDGVFDAVVRVRDGGGAEDTATIRITVSSSPAMWHPIMVRAGVSGERSKVGEFSCVTAVAGRPAIAFNEYNDAADTRSVLFVAAQNALGSAWSEPVPVHTGGAGVDSGRYLNLCLVAGRPAVGFSEEGAGSAPYYLRAAAAAGAVWTGPVHPVDQSGASCGAHLQLLDLGGVPALLYFEQTNGRLVYITGSDADGLGFNERIILDSNEGQPGVSNVGEFCDLALVDGLPAVSYLARHISAEEGNEIRYRRALDATGTTWGAAVTVDQAESIGHGTALLELAGGLPGVFYQDYNATQVLYSLARGTDASGSAWQPKLTVAASAMAHYFESPAGAICGGTPWFACVKVEDWFEPLNSVQCARAGQADGSTWESPQPVADCGDGFKVSLAEVAGRPALSWCDTVSDELWFACYY